MHIRTIEIANLRLFERERIDFLYEGREKDAAFADVRQWPPRTPNVTLFVGNNGSGKTTILDAIALAVLAPVLPSSGYRPYLLIRRSQPHIPYAEMAADIVVHEQDGPITRLAHLGTRIEHRGDIEVVAPIDRSDGNDSFPYWDEMFEERSAAFFLVGYGAMRRTEAQSATELNVRRKSRTLRYERVASLFEEHFALTPLQAWLPQHQFQTPQLYDQVVELLAAVLPSGLSFVGRLEDGEYLFAQGDEVVPFSVLSDGFRSFIGWVGDLLYHMSLSWRPGLNLRTMFGVVLVDEVDLLIHPAWQLKLLDALTSALPNMQFIFTTHSPIIVGSLERANIYYVGTESGKHVQRPPEEVFGLSADQILRSDVFGLESSRDPEFRRQLEKLNDRAQTGDPSAATDLMRKLALGAGADTSEDASIDDAPEWVKQAAKRAADPRG